MPVSNPLRSTSNVASVFFSTIVLTHCATEMRSLCSSAGDGRKRLTLRSPSRVDLFVDDDDRWLCERCWREVALPLLLLLLTALLCRRIGKGSSSVISTTSSSRGRDGVGDGVTTGGDGVTTTGGSVTCTGGLAGVTFDVGFAGRCSARLLLLPGDLLGRVDHMRWRLLHRVLLLLSLVFAFHRADAPAKRVTYNPRPRLSPCRS